MADIITSMTAGCAIIGPALISSLFLVLFYAVLVLLLTPVILVCIIVGVRDPLIAVGLWAVRVSRRVLGIKVEVADTMVASLSVPAAETRVSTTPPARSTLLVPLPPSELA